MAEKKKKQKTTSRKKATKKTVEKKEEKPKSVVKKEKNEVVYAKAKYINSSPRKARLVIDTVRGKGALDAVNELEFVNKRVALPIQKVIKSAIANAENNMEMDKKKLFIIEAYVDKAPTYRRGRAGSRGRYKRILKRNCHIIIGVKEK